MTASTASFWQKPEAHKAFSKSSLQILAIILPLKYRWQKTAEALIDYQIFEKFNSRKKIIHKQLCHCEMILRKTFASILIP